MRITCSIGSRSTSPPGNAANHAGDGVQSASFQNKALGVVFAATGGGTVYAIAAQDTNGTSGIAPGTILWKTHVGNPYAGVDGNSIGVLSTPMPGQPGGNIKSIASRIYHWGRSETSPAGVPMPPAETEAPAPIALAN